MRNFAKYSLALQVAIAGVALAQVQTDPSVTGNTGTIDDRSGMHKDAIRSDKMAPAGTVRASKLIGMEVYNQQDKHLGEIKDIVLDQNSKKVGYVVLSYGGIAGLGDKLFALPQNMLQVTMDGRNRAIVALDEQTLRNAPGFDQNKWPTEANADYYRNLDKYYDQHRGDRLSDVGDKTVDTLKDAGQKTGDALSHAGDRPQGDTSAQPAAAQVGAGNITWNHRVSDLIGANVKSPQDENLGEIHELLLDWPGGQVRYAVLSYGGILGLGDKLFAVPIDQFQARDKHLVLSIDKEQLKKAPGFDKNQWPDTANPQWSQSVDQFYRQSGVQRQDNMGQDTMPR